MKTNSTLAPPCWLGSPPPRSMTSDACLVLHVLWFAETDMNKGHKKDTITPASYCTEAVHCWPATQTQTKLGWCNISSLTVPQTESLGPPL